MATRKLSISHDDLSSERGRAVKTAGRVGLRMVGAFAASKIDVVAKVDKTVYTVNTIVSLRNALEAKNSKRVSTFDFFRDNLINGKYNYAASGTAVTDYGTIMKDAVNILTKEPERAKLNIPVNASKIEYRYANSKYMSASDREKLKNDAFKVLGKYANINTANNFSAHNTDQYDVTVLALMRNSSTVGSLTNALESFLGRKIAEDKKTYLNKLSDLQKRINASDTNIKLETMTTEQYMLLIKSNISKEETADLKKLLDINESQRKRLDEFILGRINTGQIDVEAAIKSGTFCGTKLDEEGITALRALEALGNINAINNESNKNILKNIGYQGTVQKLDLDCEKSVRQTIRLYEEALDNVGVSVRGFSEKRIAELNSHTDNYAVKDALGQLEKLKRHEKILHNQKIHKRRLRRFFIWKPLEKFAETDDTMAQGFVEIRKMLSLTSNTLSIARHLGRTAFRPAKWMLSIVDKNGHILNAIETARKAVDKINYTPRGVIDKLRKTSAEKAKERKNQESKANEKKKKINTDLEKTNDRIKKLNDARKEAQAARNAKKAEEKIIKEVGKNTAKEGAREAARAARRAGATTAGVSGTTTAAGSTTATGAAAGTAAAAGASTAVGTGAATSAAATAGTTAAAGTGAAAGTAAAANPVGIWVVLAIIIIAVIFVLILVVSRALISGLSSIDNSLFGWTDQISWSNEDYNDEPSLVRVMIDDLKKEEANFNDINYLLDNFSKKNINLHSFVIKENDALKWLPLQQIDSDKEKVVTYKWFNSGFSPITQYSTAKVSIAMTDIMAFPLVNDDASMQKVLQYNIGTFHHLNEYDVTAVAKACEDGDYVWNYYCNEEKAVIGGRNPYTVPVVSIYDFYPDNIIYDNGTGQLHNIKPKTQIDGVSIYDYVLVLKNKGTVAPYRTSGCRIKYFLEPSSGNNATVQDTTQSGVVHSGKTLPSPASDTKMEQLKTASGYNNAYKTEYLQYLYTGVQKDKNGVHNFLLRSIPIQKTKDGAVISQSNYEYVINPKIPTACYKNELASYIEADDLTAAQRTAFSNFFTVCTNLSSCTNRDTYYCPSRDCVQNTNYFLNGTITVTSPTHPKTITHASLDPCPQGCQTTVTAYKCSGYHPIVYCETDVDGNEPEIIEDPDTGEPISVFTKYCDCEDCDVKIVMVKSGKIMIPKVYYVCPGHPDEDGPLSYCFTGYCDSAEKCEHCVPVTIYSCTGKITKSCPGHTYCLGHFHCSGHPYCGGHEVTVCTGHPEYISTQTIVGNENMDKWFEEWEYTQTNEHWWWTSETTIYSEDIETAFNFDGWDDEQNYNIDRLKYMLEDDWYENYGISASEFQGGQMTDSEIRDIFYEYNLSADSVSFKRLQFIKSALKTVGFVPYYPKGTAGSPVYEENEFGKVLTGDDGYEPIKDEITGRVYAVWGLSDTALPDYAYWQIDQNDPGNKEEFLALQEAAMYYDEEGNLVEGYIPNTVRNTTLVGLNFMDAKNINEWQLANGKCQPGDVLIRLKNASGPKKEYQTAIYIAFKESEKHLTVQMANDWAAMVIIDDLSGWHIVPDVYSPSV